MGNKQIAVHEVNLCIAVAYGRNESRLEAWQRLCDDVGTSAGSTITQCRKALKSVHVNIVDFVEAIENGTTPRHFSSRKALANYTRDNPGKRYPLRLAKQNGFLTALLVSL